ncbi:TIR domain-containing protein [uncultured Methanobrevibacter sp.]|uniref:TIR domain-containing protein n=1 Tax=uncultured Methanobrevibacter sp. TaxID=253161 RepID=UPI0025ED1541|nr:TIR domain-containing protein [uncultured Methanobrevibacter sp.]
MGFFDKVKKAFGSKKGDVESQDSECSISRHDVFICYSSKNLEIANMICYVLEQNNLKCWIARRDIILGTNFHQDIHDAIESTKIIVLIFSNSCNGDYIKNQIYAAYSNNKPFIIFRVDDTIPDEYMEQIFSNNVLIDALLVPEKKLGVLVENALRLCDEYRSEALDLSDENTDKLFSHIFKDYNSSIKLLCTPFYWACFIYMGFIRNNNSWKLEGLIYFIPSILYVMFCLHIVSVFSLDFIIVLFIIFWVLAIIHGFLIRKEFISRNFKYLDGLIHSGIHEIVLDSDINLNDGEESQYLGGINLDVDELVIDGNGYTIDAKNKTRIFYCTGKNIIIKNIILKNGHAYERIGAVFHAAEMGDEEVINANPNNPHGGAIFNEGELDIYESTIKSNWGDSGAIFNVGELNICRSTIESNNGDHYGVICNIGTSNIHESKFIANVSFERTIFNGGVLNIKESLFIENRSYGGGEIHNDKGDLKIFHCEILNNTSRYFTIYNGDSLQIYNTNFKDNKSKHVINHVGSNLGIFNSEFRENDVGESIIYNHGNFCSIEKSIFEKNISKNYIINESELFLTSPKIDSGEKTILNNGYILIRKSYYGLESIIGGEGIVEIVGQLPRDEKFDFGYLDKKIYESNTKEIILEHDICFENYERDYYEGGIELDVDDLVIDGNGHIIDGVGKSRIFIITGNNITLKNITFKNGCSHKNYDNLLNNNGGAIKINKNNILTIENCKFLDNKAGNGGAVYNVGGELSIAESEFLNNEADNGGAIFCNNGILNITDSTIGENSGVAIYCGGVLNIIGSILNNNEGAIHSSGSKLNIVKSIISQNRSTYFGAVYNGMGVFTISESTFKENMSINSAGAIYNNGDLCISASTFNENVAWRYGGAILNDKNSKYKSNNCTFKDNKPDDVYEKED